MIIAKLWIISVGLTVALIGCNSTPQLDEAPRQTKGFIKEGWVAFTSARSINGPDGPGRIYRVDQEGRVFGVTIVNERPARTGDEVLYGVSQEKELTLEEILKTIGVAETVVPAKVNAKLNRHTTVVTESMDVKREFLDDRDISTTAIATAMKNIPIRDNNKYYFIRETMSANNLNFKVSKNWLANLGIEADIKKLVSTNSKFEWKDGNTVSLDRKFNSPYRLWYKPERLKFDNTDGLGVGPTEGIRRIENAVEFKLPENVKNEP